MVMVHHEVKGVVEADGKESGRCSSGGEVAFSTGSFCRQNTGQRGSSGYTEASAIWSLERRTY